MPDQFERIDNHFLFDLDYRDYFSSVHDGEIGFYFYDGEHSYESQLEGLRAAEIFFSRNCIIMVDDINLDAPLRASLDFIFESSNNIGGAWALDGMGSKYSNIISYYADIYYLIVWFYEILS